MANRVAQKAEIEETLTRIKALIDGLPAGVDLAARLAIFKKNFAVSLREYKRHKGPSDDTLRKAINGESWPNKSTLDSLCLAGTVALVSRYPGLPKRDAARAGKWLADGPIRIPLPPQSQQTEVNQDTTEARTSHNHSESTDHLGAIQRGIERLAEARAAFESSSIDSTWHLIRQSIVALKDRFEILGGYDATKLHSIEQELGVYLTLAERLCKKFAVGTEAEESCRQFVRRVLNFGKLHRRLTGSSDTFIGPYFARGKWGRCGSPYPGNQGPLAIRRTQSFHTPATSRITS